MALARKAFGVLLLVCLGCSAQSVPPDTLKLIERQVRSIYHLPPEYRVEVGPLEHSEFPNYDAVKISLVKGSHRDTLDFLLSQDRKTLIRMNKMDLTKDPNEEMMKKIDVQGRPVRGNKDAKVTVVNYDDFQCPYCSRLHQELFPQLLKEYGDRVKFVYKDFPIAELHPWATRAAINSGCLADQSPDAYWDFADYMHSNQREVNGEHGLEAQSAMVDKITLLKGQQHNLDTAKLQACIKAQKDDALEASLREGEKVGVSATPVLFINGEEVEGAVPLSDLRMALDRALTQAGVPVPAHNEAAAPKAATPVAN